MIKKIKNSKTTLYSLFDQALVSGGNFLLGIIIARTLGLEQYGLFALLWMLLLFFSSIQQALVISPMLTLLPKKEKELHSSMLSLYLIISLIWATIAAISSWYVLTNSSLIFPEIETYTGYSSFSFLVFAFLFHDFIRKSYYAISQAKKSILTDAIGYLSPCLYIAISATSYQIDISNIFNILAVFYLLGTFPAVFNLSFSKIDHLSLFENLKEIWLFSGWLVGTSVLQWLSGNFFILAAGSILGTAVIGAIRIGQNIIGVLNVILLALENLIPVKAAEAHKRLGLIGLYRYLRRSFFTFGIFVLMICLLTAVFSEPLVSLIYGNEFSHAAPILIGFCIVYLFVYAALPFRFAIRTLEKTKDIFISYVLNTIFSLLLASYIIRTFGVSGVIIGLISAQTIGIIWFKWSLRDEFQSIKNKKINPITQS